MQEERISYFTSTKLPIPKNRRWIVSILAVVAGSLLLATSFFSGPSASELAAAQEAVDRWRVAQDDASLQQMEEALRKAPSLQKRYSSLLAAALTERGRLEEGLELAHAALQEVAVDAPFHAAYGENSLLIEEGKYQEAWKQSLSLKETLQTALQERPSHISFLYAQNLLRLAFLAQELQNTQEEKEALEQLETFLSDKESTASLVEGSFREQGISLAEYIAARKEKLSS